MAQSYSDEVIVVHLRAHGMRCSISIEDDGAISSFDLEFQSAGGIGLLVGSDELTRWLMKRGKLWALRQIRELVESSTRGQMPALPQRLRDTARQGSKGA